MNSSSDQDYREAVGIMPVRVLILALCLVVVFAAPKAVSAVLKPQERIDFWYKNYTTLTDKEDARVARAREIFLRIRKVAGQRPGVEPRLHIIAESPFNVPLPMAIPDGSIILSKRVLDFCYRDARHGDDRLAFVLAHELAHQLEDDFWHMKFFQAIEASRDRRGSDSRLLDEVRHIAKSGDRILAKELRADELGIIYASMAGFNGAAIIGGRDHVNFFEEWIGFMDPQRLVSASDRNTTHPAPKQRAAAVRARLQQVVDQTQLFQVGLWYYQAGDYQRAVQAFDEFRKYFPGREVHHNLGASYHLLALHSHPQPSNPRHASKFKLSLFIDPLTRGMQGARRMANDGVRQFEENIGKAIENYQLAINQDPLYVPAHVNLACAYLLKHEPYKAIASLQDALKITPDDPQLLNDLGVAFFHADDIAKARHYLSGSRKLDSRYDAPLFNLGQISFLQNGPDQAEGYWQQYLKLDSTSGWARFIQTALGETKVKYPAETIRPETDENLMSIKVGNYDDEINKAWGRPDQREFRFGDNVHKHMRYRNGVIVIAESDEARILVASEEYTGASSRGIKIGAGENEVLRTYGVPRQVFWNTQGKSLVYPGGIAFEIQRGKVSRWLLFQD